MTEEVQEVPKWLKELEEKRERRLKARLGHEAGAGSPCLTCEEKCPGLDLHFWRKICKNCKCGKESHDVNDDDIYGWAQFQLLGSKPNKSKKFVLPGRKDAVELDWMPKGVADAVESYLKELPLNLLPIKGSPAALERKQLLQKQIPLHDIDPTLCHALSEHEIKQMNDYIDDMKQNSVGVGHILKLNELLIANRAPMQIPQMESIILQGANRANDLILKNIQDLKLNDNVPLRAVCNDIDYQNPTAVKNIQDVRYPTPLMNYTDVPNNQSIDYQDPRNMSNIRDVNYPICTNLLLDRHSNVNFLRDVNDKVLNNNALLPNQLISNKIDNQSPVNLHVTDVKYPTGQSFPSYTNQSVGRTGNLLIPNEVVPNSVEVQYPTNPNYIKDVNYSPEVQNNKMSNTNGNRNFDTNYAPVGAYNNGSNVNNLQIPQTVNNRIDNQFPNNPITMRDINYGLPNNFSDINQVNSGKIFSKLDDAQIPNHNYNILQDQSHPQPRNIPKIHNALSNLTELKQTPCGNLQIPANPVQNKLDQQTPVQVGNVRDVNYSASHPSITSIKDLAYSTYNPQPSNNPDEVNATPLAVNIGLIKDIEYPTVKSAVHTQNISEPSIPHKNVHFNLIPEEILPSCHKCNKMFDTTALVIGVDRTAALWHADCFKCAGCNQNLADLMYFYDKSSDNIYCGRDYAKIRGVPRCQACDELIFVKEYCLAENSTFHVKHFCCFECDVPLAGQNYVMEESQPLCLPCFELLKAEKCNTCLKVIKPDEQGANLKGVHFHADDNCFVCKICMKPLLGAKILFKNMNLYCSAPCFGADK